MPNYVLNKLQVIGDADKVKELMDYIRSDDGDSRIDFEKIVPIPPHIYRGNLGQAEEKMFGTDTWYEWCPKYWGTKWNALWKEDAEKCTDDTVYFQTAWGGIPKLIYLLSAKFPMVDLVYEYADEDRGYNCGRYTLQKTSNIWGTREHYEPTGGSAEANAFADQLWGKSDEEAGE